ncbi:anthranilate synthase component 1 [Thermoclostridium stercorarium subsp. stercorarium DSM 8532]|uniref:Anthranilate synthase component 1 n=1 Tax=Thermoclostridium stercorarium (strain ATCC 35414 / DSM 8532 / NCIMB 11754) TaxID=1121335 RepID=L7VQB0_THES1|nr:anthranilate synthase component I [Thermoclostridium stercorarium]AGC68992.1 anthranilate synthase component 1 [Thermoclostridium stercorarium subsp. stercorarium DSM 8532]AGI39971.1 anthranilate synthase subunit 1 [Thermoclostridium stercorarium subsp. stercorarium DSM 8532]
MTFLDYEEIVELAKNYSIVPVCREIYADITTPIALLQKISRISTRYCLLESVEGGEKWGRYSFICFNPVASVSCKDGEITFDSGEKTAFHSENPFDVLRKYLAKYRAPKIDEMPPFTGGFVGYFSYGMIGYIEPVLKLRSSEFNDFDLMLFDKVIAYDHLKQKISIIVHMNTDNVEENYRKALADIEEITDLINRHIPQSKKVTENKPLFKSNMTMEEYCNMVEKAKEYIKNGDIFQVVLSRRFETEYEGSLLNAYRVLRTTNPSPYMVFLQKDDVQLISTSPETLVRLKNGRLTTLPIAGSRPRGKNDEEDKALEKELLEDEKELAEHNMLVDLARNDLGKISKYSTVQVTNYKMIQRYSQIMHITSEVESCIKDGKDAFDAVAALLPAGTLSGAPKIRACEIIEELEKEPRGIYGGAIGYIDFTGNMDICIAIRMAVKKNNRVYVQAGAGIVADSIPEREYIETENKAKAVTEAILKAGEVE